ncbi:retron reverse transcriptase [Vibrio ichthyoenteri ATCC 700023]|uniref:Retron reverse transcriptase n=1 Tax=Vibrio ichthyoenteri ATCC 700023 TaxID=870968 RepID=F9RWE2_9VIBR|nr:reverse transcriptase family protein [Vibrio ichthyoenteri]EGU49395.1 retron reverse transcriptase [Vibrio ichthyoenteri ATCC 700023]
MDKPHYPCQPIGSIDVLANTLGVHKRKLISIASKVNTSYSSYELPAHPITKKVRTVVEAKHELKKIQKRINSRIFLHVKFPEYLQGGIRATDKVKRDYIENATKHGRSQTLINLDVKNFYPNIKSEVVRDIFKYFFKFSDEVVDILTTLTTYRGCVPQGGCTSSYLANLVFFNDEYRLVSSLRGRQLRYTRLLDDITISSVKKIDQKLSEKIIKEVAGMLRKRSLSLKSPKTKVSDRSEMHKDFEVTGLCVRDSEPKVRKKDRRHIRQLVFNCELKAVNDRTSDEYHALWNKTSGLVAKLKRLKHSQASDYRKRLAVILPLYDQYQEGKIVKRANAALKVPVDLHSKFGVMRRFNSLIYQLGILSRTNKSVAKGLSCLLKKHYSSVPSINDFWET